MSRRLVELLVHAEVEREHAYRAAAAITRAADLAYEQRVRAALLGELARLAEMLASDDPIVVRCVAAWDALPIDRLAWVHDQVVQIERRIARRCAA